MAFLEGGLAVGIELRALRRHRPLLLLVVPTTVPTTAVPTTAVPTTATALLVVLLLPATALSALLVIATAATTRMETATPTPLLAMWAEILRIASAVVVAAGVPPRIASVANIAALVRTGLVRTGLARRVGRTVVPGRPIAGRRAGLGCLRIAFTHTLRVVSSGRIWTQERRRTQESRGKFELGEAVPGETSHGLSDLGLPSCNG
ncbi:MAG: hypothetical protein WCP53_03290 [Verrucomicrobiota bacterium]